tara:strand:- start:926 stop:1447 length:522 start_codon:yes stop_codon:yes gene_type:complete
MANIKVYLDGGRVVLEESDGQPFFVDLDAKVDPSHQHVGAAVIGEVRFFNKSNVSQAWKCGFGQLLDGAGTTVGTTKVAIVTYLSNIIKGFGSPSPSETRTPTLVRTTAVSTVAAGARSVSFFNSGSTDTPTIDGVFLKQGETVSFNAGGEDDTLAAIDYSGVGGQLLIAIIV